MVGDTIVFDPMRIAARDACPSEEEQVLRQLLGMPLPCSKLLEKLNFYRCNCVYRRAPSGLALKLKPKDPASAIPGSVCT